MVVLASLRIAVHVCCIETTDLKQLVYADAHSVTGIQDNVTSVNISVTAANTQAPARTYTAANTQAPAHTYTGAYAPSSPFV